MVQKQQLIARLGIAERDTARIGTGIICHTARDAAACKFIVAKREQLRKMAGVDADELKHEWPPLDGATLPPWKTTRSPEPDMRFAFARLMRSRARAQSLHCLRHRVLDALRCGQHGVDPACRRANP